MEEVQVSIDDRQCNCFSRLTNTPTSTTGEGGESAGSDGEGSGGGGSGGGGECHGLHNNTTKLAIHRVLGSMKEVPLVEVVEAAHQVAADHRAGAHQAVEARLVEVGQIVL